MKAAAETLVHCEVSRREWDKLMESGSEEELIAYLSLGLTLQWKAVTELVVKTDLGEQILLTFRADHGAGEQEL